MFRVGQRVVCIDDTATTGRWSGDGPKKGNVYTVRHAFIDDDGDLILWLNEIARSEHARYFWGPNIGYWAKRFRPVVERKTDISVFQKLLQPKPERVE